MSAPSVLTPIREQILFWKGDLPSAKELVINTLNSAPIQDKDIKLAKVVVQHQIHNLSRLQKYVNDMILAKAGLKVV